MTQQLGNATIREYIEKNSRTGLLLIVLLALGLRVYDLGTESLWLDEVTPVQIAQNDLPGLFQAVRSGEVTPPFYYVVLHFWTGLFGTSEFAVRLPSVIFNVVSVFLIYHLAMLLFACKRTALFSALLLALSQPNWFLSQEARGYTLWCMLVLISMYCLFRVHKQFDVKIAAGYAVASCLFLYTHPYGPIIILAQNIFVLTTLLFARGSTQLSWKRWIILQLIVLAGFLPWMFALPDKLTFASKGLNLPAVDLEKIFGAFKAFAGNSIPTKWLFVALACFAPLCVRREEGKLKWRQPLDSLGQCRWSVKPNNPQQILFLTIWTLTPFVSCWLISQFFTPMYRLKYMTPASFAFYMLVARGLVNVNSKAVTVLALLVVLGLYPLSIFGYFDRVDREQWREVAALLEQQAIPSDLLIFHAPYMKKCYDHYAERNDLSTEGFPSEGRRHIERNDLPELAKMVKGHRRVWLVLSHSGKNSQAILRILEQTYQPVFQEQFKGIYVLRFDQVRPARDNVYGKHDKNDRREQAMR